MRRILITKDENILILRLIDESLKDAQFNSDQLLKLRAKIEVKYLADGTRYRICGKAKKKK